ncbi:MAG: ribosome silencing factor [Gammaproteobacteria bacterium]|nr:ribosome silencing factor [Gammaproteobacteria bacterium]
MQIENLKAIVLSALEELKGRDVQVLNVHDKTTITDFMIIATGTSTRHVQALLDNVVERCKHAGVQPLGVEGNQTAEWALADLGDIVVHVMLPAVRDFYNLDKLWGEQSPAAVGRDRRG